MTYYDFLASEYYWCLDQYARLGYESYLERATQLKKLMDQCQLESSRAA